MKILSPLPFNSLPPGFFPRVNWLRGRALRSPLPFGSLPPGFTDGEPEERMHEALVSIAFRLSAPRLRFSLDDWNKITRVSIAFRLSAPASTPHMPDRGPRSYVSIAFRLSAPRLRNGGAGRAI